MKYASTLAIVIASSVACGGNEEIPKTPTTSATTSAAPSATPSAAPSASVSAAPSASVATPPAPPAPTPAVKIAGFETPESVLYDAAGDRYFVSNIGGPAPAPLAADNNGYISIVSPDGKITTQKWVSGGANKVTLNAPKGLGIADGQLWVTDIDTVRSFDLKTGASKANIKIAGATFLNDVAVSPDGKKVYVTDSGLDEKFGPTGTDAVYEIEKGAAKALVKSKDLKNPNGVLATTAGVFVNTFGAAEVYRVGPKGEKLDVNTLPKGKLDGMFMVGDALYVSSWEGSAIYKGKLGGTFEAVLSGLAAPADIGFDSKRNRILVPRFMDNTVEAYDIK